MAQPFLSCGGAVVEAAGSNERAEFGEAPDDVFLIDFPESSCLSRVSATHPSRPSSRGTSSAVVVWWASLVGYIADVADARSRPGQRALRSRLLPTPLGPAKAEMRRGGGRAWQPRPISSRALT